MYRFTVAILLLCLTSCSASHEIEGVYYSDNQDCLVLNGKQSALESRENGIRGDLTLKQTPNKLKFTGFTHRFFFFKRARARYRFSILERKEDSFMVAPVSKDARELFNNKRYIIFTTKYHFADQTNYFTKLQFHASRCYGLCPDLLLTLDYSGNLKVTDCGEGLSGFVDTVLTGDFLGKLSYEELERLRTILKYSRLKTLDWPASRRCYDASEYTLTLHQYDTTYYFNISSACEPLVSYELTGFLYQLFYHPSLRRVDTAWTYEKEKDDNNSRGPWPHTTTEQPRSSPRKHQNFPSATPPPPSPSQQQHGYRLHQTPPPNP